MYSILKTCKSQIKALEEQRFVDCTFSASFFVKGKKSPNSIHHAAVENCSSLLRSYEKTEQPDRIKIDFFGYRAGDEQRLELITKNFDLGEIEHHSIAGLAGHQESNNNVFAGLGEAEVMELVQKKVNELDRIREMDMLKTENEALKREQAVLKQERDEFEARINAQSTIKTYASIVGNAAPILTAIFGGHPLINTATSLLSGIANEDEEKKEVDDSRATMIRMLQDFLSTLKEQDLVHVFELMRKMESDPELILRVNQYLNQNLKPQNA